MKYKVSKEIARLNYYEIRKWIEKLSGSDYYFDKNTIAPNTNWFQAKEIREEYDYFFNKELQNRRFKDKDLDPESREYQEIEYDLANSILGIRGENWRKDLDNFLEISEKYETYILITDLHPNKDRLLLDFASSNKQVLEKILLANNKFIDNFADDFQYFRPEINPEFAEKIKFESTYQTFSKLEWKSNERQSSPNYETLDSLLKLEIGRMSDEEIKFYAQERKNTNLVGSVVIILEDLGKKSLLNRVASDLVTSVDLDYQRRDDVDLIKASVDRLEKQENSDKKIRKWIDHYNYYFFEMGWSEINEGIQEKVENIKLLENKIIDLESEKQKPKLLDQVYEEFDEARENLSQIYGINDPDNLSDLVDAVNENGAKWVWIKEEKGEHKFVDFAVSHKQTLEKILKENNIDEGKDKHWIFEVYEPSSNLNLVGKMLVDNAELLNNYKTDNDIEDFVSFVIAGKISQFEAEQFGIFEKEKEVQKKAKAKTLKMKI